MGEEPTNCASTEANESGEHALAAARTMRSPDSTELAPRANRSRRRLGLVLMVGAAVALLIGITGGAASAYWSSIGSGSGPASTGTLQPVTVTAFVGGDAPSSTLIPGGSADVVLRVNNPNAYTVTLVSASGNGSITPDASHAACTTTGVTFSNQSGLSSPIAASGTTLVDLPGAASMGITSSNGCQGATFSIPVSITVQK
jgi:hypothetical protein